MNLAQQDLVATLPDTQIAAGTNTVIPASIPQQITDEAGNILTLDLNGEIMEDGIFTPDATALLKNNQVFLPAPMVKKSETNENYYITHPATGA